MPKSINIVIFLKIGVVEFGNECKMLLSLHYTIEIIIGIFVQTGNRCIFAHPEIQRFWLFFENLREERRKKRVDVFLQTRKFFIQVVALFLNISHFILFKGLLSRCPLSSENDQRSFKPRTATQNRAL